MGDGRRGDHPRGLEPGRGDPEPIEERHTVAQEHRGQVDLELVEQAGLQILLDDARTAGQMDVLVAGSRASLLEGSLDAVGRRR